jgi:hypothetical protein
MQDCAVGVNLPNVTSENGHEALASVSGSLVGVPPTGWIKSKCSNHQEFVVAGFVPSTASNTAIGSLVLGYFDDGKLIHAGRVGTGFSHKVADELFRRLDAMSIPKSPFAKKLSALDARRVRYVRPELVAEVEFRTWTPDGLIRHSTFRGLREDRLAEEVVFEVSEIDPPRRRSPFPYFKTLSEIPYFRLPMRRIMVPKGALMDDDLTLRILTCYDEQAIEVALEDDDDFTFRDFGANAVRVSVVLEDLPTQPAGQKYMISLAARTVEFS